jgi:hypothetical protein
MVVVLVIVIISSALLSGLIVGFGMRFLNEAFSLGLDDEGTFICGFIATLSAGGIAALLYFVLHVPSALLILATPVTICLAAALLCAGFWLCTRGFQKLDRYVVSQGRIMRERLQENNHDRDA